MSINVMLYFYGILNASNGEKIKLENQNGWIQVFFSINLEWKKWKNCERFGQKLGKIRKNYNWTFLL
jgi:hypothetical protein